MKKLQFYLLAAALAVVGLGGGPGVPGGPVAFAQTEAATDAADAATDAAADGAVATDAIVEVERPDMPVLFFTNEQRRILEAVRQGVVEADAFEADGFISLDISDELLPGAQGAQGIQSRSQGLKFDAIIRNRTTGKSYVFANKEIIDLTEDDPEGLGELGFAVDADVDEAFGEGYEFQGFDRIENSKFKLKIGQYVDTDGFVSENLPVIIRHKN